MQPPPPPPQQQHIRGGALTATLVGTNRTRRSRSERGMERAYHVVCGPLLRCRIVAVQCMVRGACQYCSRRGTGGASGPSWLPTTTRWYSMTDPAGLVWRTCASTHAIRRRAHTGGMRARTHRRVHKRTQQHAHGPRLHTHAAVRKASRCAHVLAHSMTLRTLLCGPWGAANASEGTCCQGLHCRTYDVRILHVAFRTIALSHAACRAPGPSSVATRAK